MAFRVPLSGDMPWLVELQKKTGAAASPDAMNYTYPLVDKDYARVWEIFGGRIVEGQQVQERITHNVTIRARSDLGAWDTVEYGKAGDRRRLRVVQVMEQRGRGVNYHEVLCEEVARGADV